MNSRPDDFQQPIQAAFLNGDHGLLADLGFGVVSHRQTGCAHHRQVVGTIADSDASMAATMRAEVRQQIVAGQKPEAIRVWMIERYGEWVSFEPDFKGAGLLLWLTPLILLFVSFWLARGLFRRRT